MGTSPAALMEALSREPPLAAALSSPRVRAALADIRADPRAGMARWGADAEVAAALDLLERWGQGQGAPGAVVDVPLE
jgi:hypothetical protein